MWKFKKLTKKQDRILSLLLIALVTIVILFHQNRVKKYQIKIANAHLKIENILNRLSKKSLFFATAKRDASDIIFPLSDIMFTPTTSICKNKLAWTHNTPKLPKKILAEIAAKKGNWLDFVVPKEINDQLIWMDELEGYSRIDFQSTPVAECIIDQIPNSYFHDFLLGDKSVIDDFLPPSIEVQAQIIGWIKVALINTLANEEQAQKSAKRIINLTRILLNSNEIWTFSSGGGALQLMRHYLKNEKTKSYAKYFPNLVEIEEILQVINFYRALLNSVSEPSVDLKAFNRPGTWPGKCARLSDQVHQTSILLKSIGVYPYRQYEGLHQIIEYNKEYCPMPHLASTFNKVYLANEKSMTFHLNLEAWRPAWNRFYSFIFSFVIQDTDLEGSRENLSKLR